MDLFRLMIFNNLRKALLLSVLFFPAFSFTSCEKFEDSSLGQEVQPEDDQIGLFQTDTFFISTKTLKADSALTDELSNNLIGSLNDPVFGRTDCGTFAHLRLSSENINFSGDTLTVDSVVLSLAYGGYYGDTNSTLQFKVMEADTTINPDDVFFSNTRIPTTGSALNDNEGEFYNIRPGTSVFVGEDTLAAQLRIRLKNSFGDRILNAGPSVLKNSTTFVDYFKGIYISTPPAAMGSGVIAYLNAISSLSKVTIYHHSPTKDGLKLNLPITASSARITTFSHDYTGTTVDQQLNNVINGEQEVYVQSGGGTKVELHFPGLLNLQDTSGLVVNKAELIVPVVSGTENPLSPHARLFVQALKEDGGKEIVEDLLYTYFDGNYRSSDHSYHFILNRYVGQLFSGVKMNYGLQLVAVGAGSNANRTILAGSNNPLTKPRLVLTYTKP